MLMVVDRLTVQTETCHPFFWLHTRKVAGHTIRNVLHPHYVEINRKEIRPFETLRPQERNDWINNYSQDIGEYDFKRMRFVKEKAYTEEEFYHMFKFAFVRNPYDRAVSMWFYLSERKYLKYNLWGRTLRDQRERFKAFLKQIPLFWEQKDSVRQKATHTWPILPDITNVDGTTLLVDFVGRIERLQEDMDHVCDILGIAHRTLRPSNVTRKAHYTEYYDDASRQLVRYLYRDDIDFFRYDYEG